jgi:hypothetical protein
LCGAYGLFYGTEVSSYKGGTAEDRDHAGPKVQAPGGGPDTGVYHEERTSEGKAISQTRFYAAIKEPTYNGRKSKHHTKAIRDI